MANKVKQNASFRYIVYFKDEDDAAIAESAIDAITMTYYDANSGTIINSRDSQDVHDTNNCTYGTSDGKFTWNGQAADTVMVDVSENVKLERHIALIEVTYSTTKKGKHEVEVIVENLRKVGNP